jgi:hypothetical protein
MCDQVGDPRPAEDDPGNDVGSEDGQVRADRTGSDNAEPRPPALGGTHRISGEVGPGPLLPEGEYLAHWTAFLLSLIRVGGIGMA